MEGSQKCALILPLIRGVFVRFSHAVWNEWDLVGMARVNSGSSSSHSCHPPASVAEQVEYVRTSLPFCVLGDCGALLIGGLHLKHPLTPMFGGLLCADMAIYRMVGNFEGIIFREKSNEGSRSSFCGFNFRDCCTVGYAHRDPLVLAHVCKLVVINFRRVKFS